MADQEPTTPSTPHEASVPQGGNKFNPFGFLFEIYRVPCTSTALLWGSAVGSTFGAHTLYKRRSPFKAIDFSIKAFTVVAAGSWIYCRRDYYRHVAGMEKVMSLNEGKGIQMDDGPLPPGAAKVSIGDILDQQQQQPTTD